MIISRSLHAQTLTHAQHLCVPETANTLIHPHTYGSGPKLHLGSGLGRKRVKQRKTASVSILKICTERNSTSDVLEKNGVGSGKGKRESNLRVRVAKPIQSDSEP